MTIKDDCIDGTEPKFKSLIVILGSLRGGEDTFRSTLAACPNADIALMVGQCERNYWHEAAKYDWSIPEPADWYLAFDSICGPKWRKLIDIGDQWLGPCGQGGSAGICLYMRNRLLRYLGIMQKYNTIILTRSDYLYFDTLPIGDRGGCGPVTDYNSVLIPDGEHYGGVTDRCHIIPRDLLLKYLHMAVRPFFDTDNLYEEMKGQSGWNLEKYIKFHLWRFDIPWKHFPYRMVSVREPTDGTRWAKGEWDAGLGKIVKYHTERMSVMQHYGHKDFLR